MLNILTELCLDLPTYLTKAVRKQTATYALDENYLSKIQIMQSAVLWCVRMCRESKKCWRHQLLQPLLSMKAYRERETIGPLAVHFGTILSWTVSFTVWSVGPRASLSILELLIRRIIMDHLKLLILFNPLNPELNPICYFLALLAHHFLHVSRIRVKSLTLRLIMSYIYGAPILDVSRSHTTTHHSR